MDTAEFRCDRRNCGCPLWICGRCAVRVRCASTSPAGAPGSWGACRPNHGARRHRVACMAAQTGQAQRECGPGPPWDCGLARESIGTGQNVSQPWIHRARAGQQGAWRERRRHCDLWTARSRRRPSLGLVADRRPASVPGLRYGRVTRRGRANPVARGRASIQRHCRREFVFQLRANCARPRCREASAPFGNRQAACCAAGLGWIPLRALEVRLGLSRCIARSRDRPIHHTRAPHPWLERCADTAGALADSRQQALPEYGAVAGSGSGAHRRVQCRATRV
jgi:hypothetical protein